jgi:hypothetical protein
VCLVTPAEHLIANFCLFITFVVIPKWLAARILRFCKEERMTRDAGIHRHIFVLAAVLAISLSWPRAQEAPASNPSAKTAQPQIPAQPVIPDKFTNLKVLPPNIEKSELMAIMKGFCRTFKVRCSHCHVATDDLSSADFPSDEKPTKQSARELLRSLKEIHVKYFDVNAPANR